MVRSLVFWGLLPFVALQALRVRRDAPRLAAAPGASSGRCGEGSPLRVVAIGDSIIAGVGASSLDKALVGQAAHALATGLQRAVEWVAIGRIGIDSGGVLDELLPALAETPADVFLISIGVNDVTALNRRSTWETNLRRLLQALSGHSPGAVIAVAGMPPLHGFPLLPQPLRALIGFRGESLDRVTRRVVAGFPAARHVPVVFGTHGDRFCSDGFHPSEASYADFGRAMARSVLSALRHQGTMSAGKAAESRCVPH